MPEGASTLSDFHWGVSHTRGRISPHFLDFENFPAPFKTYETIRRIELQKPRLWGTADLNSVLEIPALPSGEPIDMDRISQVLFLAWGVSKKSLGRNIPWFFRTVPSAGGLHPCHVYARIRNVQGVETGVYYCNMIHEFLGLIQRETPGSSRDKSPGISFVITTEIFKSTWKYRDRAFRYLLLDTGHLVENFTLAINAMKVTSRVFYDFTDSALSGFLGLDTRREIPLAWIDVQPGQDQEGPGLWAKTEIGPAGQRAREIPGQALPVFYPLLEKFYQFTRLDQTSVEPTPCLSFSRAPESTKEPCPGPDYVQTLFSRRSRRDFVPNLLGADKARDLLDKASGLLSKGTGINPGLDLRVSCRHVEGREDGMYQFSRATGTFVLTTRGNLQEGLSRVCLDQGWIRNAAMNFLFITDLVALEQESGPRGYRHVFMDAGRMGQRIYLAAQGLGLGCCAVGALYDREAQALLDLEPETALFYVVSAGPVKGAV